VIAELLVELFYQQVEKRAAKTKHKYVRLRWLTYIHTCRSYVHKPRKLDRNAVESPTGTFVVLQRVADSSDFGLLGEQSSPKWEIPCLGRRWTAVQNLTPPALSSADKSVTVQTHARTQTVTDISTPLAYRHVWIITCDILQYEYQYIRSSTHSCNPETSQKFLIDTEALNARDDCN